MKAWETLLEFQRQIIFTGPPGTGKTLQAKRLAARMISGRQLAPRAVDLDQEFNDRQVGPGYIRPAKGGIWDIVQFHPSYNYDDFVRGLRVRTEDRISIYHVKDGPLLRMATLAENNPRVNFVLIIDEINRTNVAAVLGELIYALEYRERPVTLQYGDSKQAAVKIPTNLYIIGTMNTADRSIGHIDYAVRRRFAFVPLMPDREVVNTAYGDDQAELREIALDAFDEVAALFDEDGDLLTPDYKAHDVQIGHSYFLARSVDELLCKLEYQVVPLLREYIADGVLRPAASVRVDRIAKFGGAG